MLNLSFTPNKPGITPPAKSFNLPKRFMILHEFFPKLYNIYFKAYAAYLAGKTYRNRHFTVDRLERGLILITTGQAEEKFKQYHTTLKGCNCQDYRDGHFICKHGIALMLLTRVKGE